MRPKTVRTTNHERPLECPSCKTSLDASTSVQREHTPKENDVTVCFNCGSVSQYNAGATSLRACPDFETLHGLDYQARDEIRRVRRFIARRKTN